MSPSQEHILLILKLINLQRIVRFLERCEKIPQVLPYHYPHLVQVPPGIYYPLLSNPWTFSAYPSISADFCLYTHSGMPYPSLTPG